MQAQRVDTLITFTRSLASRAFLSWLPARSLHVTIRVFKKLATGLLSQDRQNALPH